MRRIMVVGLPGSGKSTLAGQMNAALGLPLFHVDRLTKPFGKPRLTKEQALAAIAEVTAQDAYILEGAHGATYPARVADCDTLIWLDLGLLLCLYRICRRMRTDKRLGPACDEPTGREIGKLTPWKLVRRYLGWKGDLNALMAMTPPAVRVIRLRSPMAVRDFIAGLAGESGGSN